MTGNSKFLDELKKSTSYSKSIKVILNFINESKELSFSEIKDMINISVKNKQVLDVLNLWDENKHPKNKKCIDFYSKYVDKLIDERKSLDENTLTNLDKLFSIIYLTYLKADREKEDVCLYHANSVITSLSFISSKKLFSREHGEKIGLPQTYQRSDDIDKEKGIFNDIFFDNCDIGKNFLCSYGPITFVFKAGEILSLGNEVMITKDNPIRDIDEYMYFSSLSEIKKQMTKYIEGEEGGYRFFTKFKHHTTLRNCDYIDITIDNLERIEIEAVENVNEFNQDGECEEGYSSEKIKEIIEFALAKQNLKGIKVNIRPTKNKNYPPSYSTSLKELWSTNLDVLYRKED